MRKISLTIAAVALALAASSAMADTTTPAPATDANSTPAAAMPATPAASTTGSTAATTTAATDPNAEVCKRLAPETGTRIGSRMVCKTNAQWDAMMRDNQQAKRTIDNTMTGYTGPTGAMGH